MRTVLAAKRRRLRIRRGVRRLAVKGAPSFGQRFLQVVVEFVSSQRGRLERIGGGGLFATEQHDQLQGAETA